MHVRTKPTVGGNDMKIIEDDLSGAAIQHLISSHLVSMNETSPSESVHALGIDKLRGADVTVWSAWIEESLAGCGALKELDPTHGEIKSMKTDPGHLRKGVAGALLSHIIQEAKNRGYHRLSLETGSMDAFLPAQLLYERAGFHYCPPFGAYTDDPNSRFMTLEL